MTRAASIRVGLPAQRAGYNLHPATLANSPTVRPDAISIIPVRGGRAVTVMRPVARYENLPRSNDFGEKIARRCVVWRLRASKTGVWTPDRAVPVTAS